MQNPPLLALINYKQIKEQVTTNHIPIPHFGAFTSGGCRHDFGERSYTPIVTEHENSKDISKIKACKRGLEWACGPGQHVLDKHVEYGFIALFLGLEACQVECEIFISQRKYVKDIMSKYSMLNCNRVVTLMRNYNMRKEQKW